MKFNEKLKELRLNKNMTQEDLALKLHISRQSVSKWEQGLTEPNIETLKKLCVIFDVSISELINDGKDIISTKEERRNRIGKNLFIANGAFVLFGIFLSGVLIKMMPDRVPMHRDFFGNITRYGSKWETLLFVATFMLFFGISAFIHYFYKKNKNEFLSGLIASQIVLFVAQLIIGSIYVWTAFTSISDNTLIIPALTGIGFSLFITLSVFSYPIFNPKRNAMFGFRTFFTLSNDEAWYKVNRFQSISAFFFSLLGYITILITFKEWNIYLIALIIISVIPTFIYHEILKNKIKKRT